MKSTQRKAESEQRKITNDILLKVIFIVYPWTYQLYKPTYFLIKKASCKNKNSTENTQAPLIRFTYC